MIAAETCSACGEPATVMVEVTLIWVVERTLQHAKALIVVIALTPEL